MGYTTKPFDRLTYSRRIQTDSGAGRCFICDIVNGHAEVDRPIIHRDEVCIAFFPRWPRLLGYVLVAPLEHRTEVVAEFPEEEYLQVQHRIHRIGNAIMQVVPTERLYVFSFGSHSGVAHVHWHLVPLSPGTPFEEQQFAAVNKPIYLDIPETEQRELAERIQQAMRGQIT